MTGYAIAETDLWSLTLQHVENLSNNHLKFIDMKAEDFLKENAVIVQCVEDRSGADVVGLLDALESVPIAHNEAVKKWTLWCFNYPTPFEKTIGKIWGGTIRGFGGSYRCEDNHFTQHLIEKWQSARHNDAHMLYFYSELDTENREKLVNWVMSNYKG